MYMYVHAVLYVILCGVVCLFGRGGAHCTCMYDVCGKYCLAGGAHKCTGGIPDSFP